MLKKIAMACGIFASACIGDGVGGDPGALYTDKGVSPSEQESTQLTVTEAPPQMDPSNVCDLLPPGDGACAHACDQDALLSYIPEGSCVTFSCTLTNGQQYVTGGCND